MQWKDVINTGAGQSAADMSGFWGADSKGRVVGGGVETHQLCVQLPLGSSHARFEIKLPQMKRKTSVQLTHSVKRTRGVEVGKGVGGAEP